MMKPTIHRNSAMRTRCRAGVIPCFVDATFPFSSFKICCDELKAKEITFVMGKMGGRCDQKETNCTVGGSGRRGKDDDTSVC